MPKSKATYRYGDFILKRREGSPNYYVAWFDRITGQTKRKSLNTVNIKEAKTRLKQFAILREQWRNAPPEEIRIVDVMVRYYDSYAHELPSEEAISYHIIKWTDYFGERVVSDLIPAQQEAFVKHLQAKGCSAGYIRRIMVTGRAALIRAVKRQELDSHPYIQMPKKEAPNRQATRLQPEEMARLLQAAHSQSQRLFMFCLIAVNTLSRPSAIYDLTIDQINFDDRLIDLNRPGRSQTKKYRPIVPITDTLLPWLRVAVKNSNSGHFIEYNGKPVKTLRKAFKKAVADAKLPDTVTPYSLRHTMATELRRRKVDVSELAGLMGHKIQETTEIYAVYDPSYQRDAAEAIDSYCQEIQRFVSSGLSINLVGLRSNNVPVKSGK